MPLFTERMARTWGAGGELIGNTVTKSAAIRQGFSETVPNGTSNRPMSFDWASGKLVMWFIVVDKDCTIYVNDVSGGSPTDTIPLKANVPMTFIKDSGEKVPFTGTAGAVTEIYISIPDTDPDEDAEVEARALIDV